MAQSNLRQMKPSELPPSGCETREPPGLGLRTSSNHEDLLFLHRQGDVHVRAVAEEVKVGPVEPVEGPHQGHRRLTEVLGCQLRGVSAAVVGHQRSKIQSCKATDV